MLINFDVSTDLFVPMREDDEKRRWYYASAEPRVVLRLDGFSIDEVARGEWCDGLVGWDRGDANYVLPQNVGLRHTKITLKSHGIQTFDANTPPQDLKMMSEILADAPRNRRFERVTRVTITTHEEAELNDPVTVSEAALMLFGADGARELMRVNRLIESGALQEYVAANEPNPRRARRLSRSEVQAFKRMRSQRK